MTVPPDEEDVVVELRLQPVVARPDGWRGRSSGLIAAGLVGFIVVGIALGAAFDERQPASSPAALVPEPSPAISAPASRRPSVTARPRLPPLPALEVVGGQIPTERRLVYASGLQMLDLGTGELTTPPRPYEDILLSVGDDEMVCVCMTREHPGGDTRIANVDLRFERLDATGNLLVERDVMTFDGIVDVPEVSLGFAMAAAVSADHQYLYVLTSSRRPPTWVIELHQLDAGSGELVGSATIDELAVVAEDPGEPPSSPPAVATPGGAPPDGVHVWFNALGRSPDGQSMAATIGYSVVRGGSWSNGFRELLLPLADGQPGSAARVDAGVELGQDSWCFGPPEFVDDELLVMVCNVRDGRGRDDFRVRRLPTDGAAMGDVALLARPTDDRSQPAIAVDRGRRAVVSWNPVSHTMARVSIDDSTVIEGEVARAMLPESEPGSSRGFFGADPGLVLSPDGRRLYALGFTLGPSDSGTPTGVWVFDAETLDLLDHWLPRAMLTSIAISDDGRFVYAAGANSFDVEGNQAPNWPSSVTVYDAQTGEIQVVYGEVSRDSWVSFRSLP